MEKNRSNLGILGCGWLGIPLAKNLIKDGFYVRGSARKKENLLRIEATNARAYHVNCTEDGCETCEDFLRGLDWLIICLPPGVRHNPSRRFDRAMEHLVDSIVSEKIQKVIFISSISVYGWQAGVITEQHPLLPTTESGKQLIKCEHLLLSNPHFETVVLRFGGLIGPNRNPIHQLSKKSFIPNPNDVINFIHQVDCIEIIKACIDQFKGGEVYNAVSPYHPKRVDFYIQLAKKQGLDCPPFKEIRLGERHISSAKLKKELGVKFLVENLLT